MFRSMTWKLTALSLLALSLPAFAAGADASYNHIDHKARFDYDVNVARHRQTAHHAHVTRTTTTPLVRLNLTRR